MIQGLGLSVTAVPIVPIVPIVPVVTVITVITTVTGTTVVGRAIIVISDYLGRRMVCSRSLCGSHQMHSLLIGIRGEMFLPDSSYDDLFRHKGCGTGDERNEFAVDTSFDKDSPYGHQNDPSRDHP